MRIIRALGDFLTDVSQGDPVALGIAGFFLFLAIVVASIWVIDIRKRAAEKKRKKPPEKQKPIAKKK